MDIKLEKDIIVISEIVDDAGGFIIHVFPDGVVYLFEVKSSGVQFAPLKFTNLYNAIITAKSWT